MQIRVAHVVPALFDAEDGIPGGAERYAFELARNMAQEVPTTLVTFGRSFREESVGPLKIKVIGNPHYIRGQTTNPFSFALLQEIRNVSVVHCHQQHVVASSFSAAVARITGRKVVVTDLGGGGWDVSGYVSTDRWFHAHLHLSEFSKKVFGHSNNRSSAYVIYGGVDTEKFSPSNSVGKSKTILFVGRILPHKGIEHLIDAVDSGMELEIVGKVLNTTYQKELFVRAENKSVTFAGVCSDEELVHKYRKSRCVVLPSVYRTMYGENVVVPELLGQTLLESMSCGTPVICTDAGAMPELVQNGITGFVVPPGDSVRLNEKLKELLQDPDKAMEMGRAGRKHVMDNFQWSMVVNRCLKIYESL